jgi:hypothetical protein
MLVSRKIDGPLPKVNLFYAGAVICGANLKDDKIYVHGLTLKFKSPAVATVTFAATPASPQVPLTRAQVIAQIKAAVPALEPKIMQVGDVFALVLVEATPASGVTVDKTGTANQKLGLSTAADTVGKFINPPGGATPYLVWLSVLDANTYVVTTEE